MHINIAVVTGIMTTEPVHRELASGDTMVQFDVSTSVERDGRMVNTSVPVSWRNPSAAAAGALVAGDEVVVAGRIARRFFRSGGATQTRTELVADRCLPARRSKTVRSVLAAVAVTLAPEPQAC